MPLPGEYKYGNRQRLVAGSEYMGIRHRSVLFEHGRRCKPFGRETAALPVLDGNSLYGDGEGRWTMVSLGLLGDGLQWASLRYIPSG